MSQVYGKVNKTLPAGISESAQGEVRLGKYAEVATNALLSGNNAIADEGSYFTAMGAADTAYNFSGATQTAWVATTPTFFIRNNAAAAGVRIYMDYIRIKFTTAGTAGTRIEGAVFIDTGARTTSAGTALTVVNVNGAQQTATNSTGVVAGAITANAAVTPKQLYRFSLSTVIPAIGETYLITFGNQTGMTHTDKTASCGPCIIDGGQTCLLYLWSPSQSATPTVEMNAGWYER